ncbi:MAG TPA: hypothetical protein VF607_12025 [Verrucomicrobiae bacterium]
MKAKLILKSLTDLPANTLALAAAMPGHAVGISKYVLGPAVKATRREVRAARRRSQELARHIHMRATTPFTSIAPWARAGLNE